MVADRFIPIKYNSLLGFSDRVDYDFDPEDANDGDDEYLNYLLASSEMIPLGVFLHECSYEKKKSKTLNKTTRNRKEKRKLLFKNKMKDSHYSFIGENVNELGGEYGTNITASYMLVMVRKDASEMYHGNEDYFEGKSIYRIALLNLKKFRLIANLEDLIYLDIERNGKLLKHLEMSGNFSRRNHHLVHYEREEKLSNHHHITETGVLTIMAEKLCIRFRIVMDRLVITNSRILLENYTDKSPLEMKTEIISGGLTIVSSTDSLGEATYSVSVNNNQIIMFNLNTLQTRKFPLPSIIAQKPRAVLKCEKPTGAIDINFISESDILVLGIGGSNFNLSIDDAFSKMVSHHFDGGYRLGGYSRMTETKYLLSLERHFDPAEFEKVFENTKWLVIDLYSKTVNRILPKSYKTRIEEDAEEGFTTVKKKHFKNTLSSYGGELSGKTEELEGVNWPHFIDTKRNMLCYRPYAHNQDLFVVKTFFYSSTTGKPAQMFLKSDLLSIVHFTLLFQDTEETKIKLERNFFTDLEIRTDH